MTKHYAYGRTIDDLDVVIVDDSKPMQAILRSTLASFKVRRVRVFDGASEAIEAMRIDPPNLILTDLLMKPVSGYQFLLQIRHRRLAPLCFLPVLFVTAHGTRTVVDKILRAGAQNILVKPVSPSALYERLNWTLRDSRELTLDDNGRYSIRGVAELLDEKARKWKQFGDPRNRLGLAQSETVAARKAAPRGLPSPAKTDAEIVGGKRPRTDFAAVRPK